MDLRNANRPDILGEIKQEIESLDAPESGKNSGEVSPVTSPPESPIGSPTRPSTPLKPKFPSLQETSLSQSASDIRRSNWTGHIVRPPPGEPPLPLERPRLRECDSLHRKLLEKSPLLAIEGEPEVEAVRLTSRGRIRQNVATQNIPLIRSTMGTTVFRAPAAPLRSPNREDGEAPESPTSPERDLDTPLSDNSLKVQGKRRVTRQKSRTLMGMQKFMSPVHVQNPVPDQPRPPRNRRPSHLFKSPLASIHFEEAPPSP
jgi:hypothetical protein